MSTELEPELSVMAHEMPDGFTWVEEPKTESILAGTPMENLRRFGCQPERE